MIFEIDCEACDGTGFTPDLATCWDCNGTGKIELDEQTLRDMAGEEKFEAMREDDWPD